VFNFGVIYQTGLDQLKAIPEKTKEIIEREENCTFDRCHFTSFGNFSLDFETVYYIGTADYNVYMDIQQRINLAIFEDFAANGIEFAYPTQTLFVADSAN
jgi:small-conductance mechanosensitive channel